MTRSDDLGDNAALTPNDALGDVHATVPKKIRDPSDMRLNNAWSLWCRRLFEEHPERQVATQGESTFSAFAQGWHFRFEAAVKNQDGRDAHEITIIRDQFDLFRREYDRAWEEVFRLMKAAHVRSKIISSQALMLREANLNPLDAPVWKRVTEQRKEIKRLTRENDRLRVEIANAKEPADVGPKTNGATS